MNSHVGKKGALWSLYERVVMVIGLGSLAAICLAWLPLAMLLHPVLPKATGQRVGRFCISQGMRLYLRILSLISFRFDLAELDQLRDAGPLIIAANHPSLLDVVMITSRLPNVFCVMKSSLMNNPLLGSAARLAGYVRNDGAFAMILNSRRTLANGSQLVVFPEGSRTQHFPVDPLMPSFAVIAQRSHTPVQTVFLEFSTPYLGKAWPLFRPPTLPLYCRARLGKRFPPPANAQAFSQELHAYFSREIQAVSTS